MRGRLETTTILLVSLLLLILLASGCTPRQRVYIPKEWRTAQTPSTSATVPGSKGVEPTPQPMAPVLQPTPKIQERDLGSANSLTSKSPSRSGPDDVFEEPAIPKSAQPQTPPEPQHLASMHLVDNARTALNNGNADQAITQLEQAIQVDAYNGEAFFQLARAWQTKGDHKRALEFARKSEILFQDQPRELKKVYLLEAELLKLSGQASEAEIYRQKAKRLGM